VVAITTYTLVWGLDGPEEQLLADATGFFFGYPGEIITNAHVVADAWRIEVTLADGRTAEASLLGLEALTDLALLKVEIDSPPPSLTIMAEDEVRAGLWVLAIGHPLGLEFSASKGIISAVNRTDVVRDSMGYWDFIQTDAAINQGNSGGPLVDRFGRLAGICTAVDKEGRRIAYAIPVGIVDVMAHHLRLYGRLRRAYLGIDVREADDGIAVTGIFPDSPAYFSGFKPGDIVVEFDGEIPESVTEFYWNVAIHSLEEPAEFELERDGVRLLVAVQLEPAASDSGMLGRR
jgi:serine protease Do